MLPAPHSPHAACFENHFDVVQSWFFLNSMLFGFLGAWFSDLFFPCSEAYRMESKGRRVSLLAHDLNPEDGMQKLRRAGRAGALWKEFAKQMYSFPKTWLHDNTSVVFSFSGTCDSYDGIWQWYEDLQISFYMKFSSLPGIPKDPGDEGSPSPRQARSNFFWGGGDDLQLGMMSFCPIPCRCCLQFGFI